MKYCINRQCPFRACANHLSNAPKNSRIVIASIDASCRPYIAYLVDTAAKERGAGDGKTK